MLVRNGTGMEELTQLGPSEARRTLGVWQAIDGNEREQTKQMKKKATAWARAIARSSLTRQDTVQTSRLSINSNQLLFSNRPGFIIDASHMYNIYKPTYEAKYEKIIFEISLEADLP